jgi:hypothetical protein
MLPTFVQFWGLQSSRWHKICLKDKQGVVPACNFVQKYVTSDISEFKIIIILPSKAKHNHDQTQK